MRIFKLGQFSLAINQRKKGFSPHTPLLAGSGLHGVVRKRAAVPADTLLGEDREEVALEIRLRINTQQKLGESVRV